MSADPISVLEAIVAEVAGAGQPFSADSFLPPHLIHDARQAIEAEHKDAAEWKAREAHEALLLARLSKADEMIASLRAEIDALRSEVEKDRSAYNKANRRVSALYETIDELESRIDAPRHPKISSQPPDSLFGQWKAAPDDASRLMHVTVYARQECDA